MGWYDYAARHLVEGKSVLDVGCGLAAGLDVLSRKAADARGQDLDPRLQRANVFIGPVTDIPEKSVDVVTCIDVIEHIEEDAEFVRHLGRIARDIVFVSTPNWALSRCQWPYHVREYTPRQLRTLLTSIGTVRMMKGEPNGYSNWTVNDQSYDLLNDLRIWRPTAFAARCLSKILPAPLRLRAHLAAIVHVSS